MKGLLVRGVVVASVCCALAFAAAADCTISVTAGANGSAKVNGADSATVATGSRVTVTQTPADGYFFGKWTGDVPAEHNKDQSLSFVVRDQSYSLSASFLPIVYVKPDGSDEAAGTSWETAMATIPAALARDADGTGVCVLLADGVYESATQIKLTTGSTIAGASEGAKAVLKLTAKLSEGDRDYGTSDSFIVLAHEDARLYNVAVTTGADAEKGKISQSDGYGRCVWIEKAGFVDHCVITNGVSRPTSKSTSLYKKYDTLAFGSGGVTLNGGGVVRGCDISRNTIVSQYFALAMGGNVVLFNGGLVDGCRIELSNYYWGFSRMVMAGLAMNGGIVRNSLIARNDWDGTSYDAHHGKNFPTPTGVYMDGGVLENCTVAANSMTKPAKALGVYLVGDAVVRNCVIWGNRNECGVSNWSTEPWYVDGSEILSWTGSMTYTCTTPPPAGDGNLAVEPPFADADAGDFSLPPSALADGGVWSDWMDWATDLAGAPRVSGSAPDLGCYEIPDNAVSVGFDIGQSDAFDAVTLKAVVVGADAEGLAYRWTLTPEGGEAVTFAADSATVERTDVAAGRYTVKVEALRDAAAIASHTGDGVVVHPKDIYMALAGSGTFPYDTPAKATTDLAAAVEAAAYAGSTIHVGEGLFKTANSVVVTKGVAIVGEGPEKTALDMSGKASLAVAHSDAVVSGVAVSNAYWSAVAGQAICLSNGAKATNCTFASSKAYGGAALGVLCGASVVDCRLTGNTSAGGAGYKTGAALYVAGDESLVDRCVVDASASVNDYSAVYLVDGTLRNTIVASNKVCNASKTIAAAAVAAWAASSVENCTIVGNVDSGTQEGRVAGLRIGSTAASVVNTIAYGNTSLDAAANIGGVSGYEACLTTSLTDGSDPKFRDGAARPFAPQLSSPCANAGTTLSWMDAGALDVYGRPRVVGGKPDIGAAECQTAGLQIILR